MTLRINLQIRSWWFIPCVIVLFGILIHPAFGQTSERQGYYRFPALHDDTVIFTAEGDLWTVGIAGGTARRLTTHHGVESRASISPDGTTIAFNAQYEGPTEVYAMSLNGGLPKRLTYGAERCRVAGWTPDGKIIYTSRHLSTLSDAQLFVLQPKTAESTPIPLSQAADGVYDAAGKTLYFTRLPFQGSHTKRYKGGSVEQIWAFAEGAPEAVPLTQSYPGTSRDPMWWNGRVYFASDRDGTMNLWSMDEQGQDPKQHTHHSGWDVKSPSLSNGKIVYQVGADLHRYDIATEEDRLIPIALASDFDHLRDKWVKNPMSYLSAVHLSPEGDRVALTARGRVFVMPVKQGRRVEVTRKQGVRYRNARFMPDGKTLLMQSDETGEIEFWTAQANGRGRVVNLTQDATVFRNSGTVSPDGKWVAFTDRDLKLWLLDVTKKTTRVIAQSNTSGFGHLRWSPDSRWLAYVADAGNWYSQIHLYNIAKNKDTAVTTDRVDSYNPAWSPDGKWLYFLSDRYFRSIVGSPWGARQPDPFFDRTTKIYALALEKETRFPFLPDNEVIDQKTKKEKPSDDKKADKDKKEKDKKAKEVVIDLDGIQARIFEVPVKAGFYRSLTVTDKHLYLTEDGTSLEPQRKLIAIKIANDDIKKTTLLDGMSRYQLSQDQKHVLAQKEQALYVFQANGSAPKKLDDSKVDLSRWLFTVDPKEEWRQMFVDAWRMERDYFYDPNLHGIDWKGLLDRHLPLVDRITDRDELDDLIAHLVGELGALHIFVSGGDKRRGDDNIPLASLGAELSRDSTRSGYRIDRIYQGDPDYPDRLSPLQRPDIRVREGDVITAINGLSTLSTAHLTELLENQSGRQVLLTIKTQDGASRDVIVQPISLGQLRNLRYDDWEYSRRIRVEEAGQGDIGYVHLRAMGRGDIAQWVRNYYPVFDRKGLIVDVRHNGGGNIDSWILGKLLRKAWFYWKRRKGKPTWNMQYAFRGHMVVLCDEKTGSDGEAFTEGFRRLGLGEVIGTRTWGGEIWLSFNNRLVDRGIASAAQMGVYGPEGKWLIEGHGVDPDIVVDNLPHATYNGSDAQLDAAIAHLKQKIKETPVDVPPPPPYPIQTSHDDQ